MSNEEPGTTPLSGFGEDEPYQEPAPRRRALRRVLIGLGVLTAVLLLLVGGGFWYLTEGYAGNI